MKYINNIISIIASSIEDINYKEKMIISYFDRINAPYDIKHIDHIAREMKKIINILKKACKEENEDLLNTWEDINTGILASLKLLDVDGVKLLSSDLTKNRNTKDASLHGYIKSHPLYAMLWHIESNDESTKQYQNLKSVMFRIWPDLKRKTSEYYLYNISRIVRILGEDIRKETLKILPSKPQAVIDYMNSLDKLLHNNDKPLISYEVEEISRSIKIALCIKEFSSHDHGGGLGGAGGKSRGIRPGAQRLELVDSLEDETDPEFKRINIYRLNDLDGGGFRSGDYDLTTDDLVEEYDVMELIPRAENYCDLDPKLEALRVRGMKSAMAISGQFLPSHTSVMNIWEVGNIFKNINNNLIKGVVSDDNFIRAIILAAILIYGRDIEEICQMTVHHNPLSNIPQGGIAYITNLKCIQIRIDGPIYRTSLDQEKESEALPVDKSILLVCPPLLSEAIEMQANNSKPEKARSGYKLFKESGKEHKRNIDKVVHDITESKMTCIAVRRYIFQIFLEESTDVAVAMMLTNQRYGMPETRLHYTTLEKNKLSDIHRVAIQNLIKLMFFEFEDMQGDIGRWLNENSHEQKGYVGSRLTSTSEARQKLVRELKNKISNLRNDDVINFHNAFTAYCVVMLDYATASRAVARKYFLESDMCFESNTMLVWDKNAGDTINSRIVYLPDVCIEQIKEYRRHRKLVIERMTSLPDSEFHLLTDPLNQKPTSFYKNKLRAHVDSCYGQFFFLDNKGKPKQLHPKLIREQLDGIFHLPPNVNRHNFRFNMCKELVNGEFMDAYLGHSIWGEEAYGRYSTLSLDEVLNQLNSKIEKNMIEDGWSVVRGLRK